MAIIVFRANNNNSGGPLAWKRGMPVEILPNSHVFSAREMLPPAQGGSFIRVTISDVTVQQIEDAITTRWGFRISDLDFDPTGDRQDPFVAIRRRKLHLRIEGLPPNIRNQMFNTGAYTTTWASIRPFIQNIRTLENF